MTTTFKLIDGTNLVDSQHLSLNDWLYLREGNLDDIDFVHHMFPNEEIAKQYLSNIEQYSQDDIDTLLGDFLMQSTSLNIDEDRMKFLKHHMENRGSIDELSCKEYYNRLFRWTIFGERGSPPWEGVTWVLDLLPQKPKIAIEVIYAYIGAHFWVLPDGRITGLNDAASVIRARYIGLPSTKIEMQQFLKQLTPREFEHLIERLYYHMGYVTQITPETRDGGKDIVATKNVSAQRERIAIECKLYSKPVGIRHVDRLLGVVVRERCNRGVVFSSSNFTDPARAAANQSGMIELIPKGELILLLNEHLGADWPYKLDRLIQASQRTTSN